MTLIMDLHPHLRVAAPQQGIAAEACDRRRPRAHRAGDRDLLAAWTRHFQGCSSGPSVQVLACTACGKIS